MCVLTRAPRTFRFPENPLLLDNSLRYYPPPRFVTSEYYSPWPARCCMLDVCCRLSRSFHIVVVTWWLPLMTPSSLLLLVHFYSAGSHIVSNAPHRPLHIKLSFFSCCCTSADPKRNTVSCVTSTSWRLTCPVWGRSVRSVVVTHHCQVPSLLCHCHMTSSLILYVSRCANQSLLFVSCNCRCVTLYKYWPMPRSTLKNYAPKLGNVAWGPKAWGQRYTIEGHTFSVLIEANSQYLFCYIAKKQQ